MEDLCGSKAGIAIYTAPAFPSWVIDPVREFEGCFLMRALRKPFQGRRGSKFWEEILQAPSPPWVISHGHRVPTLTRLSSFVLENLGPLFFKAHGFPSPDGSSHYLHSKTGSGKHVNCRDGNKCKVWVWSPLRRSSSGC